MMQAMSIYSQLKLMIMWWFLVLFRFKQENIWFSSSIHLTCELQLLCFFGIIYQTYSPLSLSLPSRAPIHSTFVCPTEILAFSDRVNEFKTINTEVVACSVDSKFTHFAWINTPREEGGLKGLKIPLLSDLTKQISKDYGVLLENEGHSLRLASLGNLLATKKIWIFFFYLSLNRGLFIIDDKGILRQITMNDIPVSIHVNNLWCEWAHLSGTVKILLGFHQNIFVKCV